MFGPNIRLSVGDLGGESWLAGAGEVRLSPVSRGAFRGGECSLREGLVGLVLVGLALVGLALVGLENSSLLVLSASLLLGLRASLAPGLSAPSLLLARRAGLSVLRATSFLPGLLVLAGSQASLRLDRRGPAVPALSRGGGTTLMLTLLCSDLDELWFSSDLTLDSTKPAADLLGERRPSPLARDSLSLPKPAVL